MEQMALIATKIEHKYRRCTLICADQRASAFISVLFSHQATGLSAPITMKKLQSGKVAKPHVVKPATLQPCNPVIFTSGNMPAGTDNHEKVAEWQSCKAACGQACHSATLQPCHFHIRQHACRTDNHENALCLCTSAPLHLCVEGILTSRGTLYPNRPVQASSQHM
jgi:hypothetical protein